MKTYILDVIKRIKRFSEEFNVQTTLCDKTWVVFNDTGEKELYIFQPDGTAFITNNGIGIKGQWRWVSANQSLVINKDGKVIMLHPEYIDKSILALNLDGTNKIAFLIEENHLKVFPAKTLAQLEQYFIRKEKYLIEKDKLKVEWDRLQRIDTIISNAEKRIKEHQQWQKDNEERIMKEAKELKKQLESEYHSLLGCVFGPLWIIFISVAKTYFQSSSLAKGIAIALVSTYIILLIITFRIDNKRTNMRVKKWKNEHPNDPRMKYLDYF